jgi:Cft2 family RNA processing exonuclease
VTGQVVWDHGVSLPGHRLWLDPLVVRSFAFISHAHTDHARRHKEALLTPQTLALIPPERRPRGWRMLGFGETMRRGDGSVELHPAGHMLGSAQLHFQHDGWSVLYTGDIKLRQTGRVETFVPRADVLIVETTYGRPHFRFGDPDETVELIARWCRRALDSNVTPVLLCHALGKTEEVMLQLAPYGFEFALEKRCVTCARQYASAGRLLPGWVELDGQPIGDRVVIAPPAGKDEIRRCLGRYRTALVSGWAKDPDFARMFGADATFDLSDHCDFDELMQVVERSGARQVYTVHGYTEDFARSLRRKGVRAWALEANEQLALAL